MVSHNMKKWEKILTRLELFLPSAEMFCTGQGEHPLAIYTHKKANTMSCII